MESSVGPANPQLRGDKTPRGRGSLLPTVPETKLPYEPAPVVITSSVGADRTQERLVSNLLPVVELPQTVFSAETPLRSKADIHQYSDKVSHPAFVLREGRLWTIVNLRENGESFGTSVQPTTIREDAFESWLSDADHARWAVTLDEFHLCASNSTLCLLRRFPSPISETPLGPTFT
jgi:hypothetical protein